MTPARMSVITPLHFVNLPYITAAYTSVMSQDLPSAWELEWVLQLDGMSFEQLPAQVRDDHRVCLGRNDQAGAAVTRTVALTRSSGSLIRNLDADDFLLPGALAREISLMELRSEVNWICSQALDLNHDGTRTVWPHELPPEGLLPRGWIHQYWLANNRRLPVVPGTVCIRRWLLAALGGWMALPASEDTGMLLAASTLSRGYYIRQPSMLYRKHAGQSTAKNASAPAELIEARHNLINERVASISAMLGTLLEHTSENAED